MFIITTSIILFIALFIGLSLRANSQKIYFQFRGRSFLAFLAFLIIIPTLFVQVDANEVGIVYDPLAGGIQDESLSEGLHIKTPFQQVKIISTKLREESYTVTAQTGIIVKTDDQGNTEETGGGQFATYQVTLQYKVEVGNAGEFYRKFGGDIVPSSTLEARVREALQSNSVDYDIYTILKGGLNAVRFETEEDLIDSLDELGITVEAFIIKDVDAGEDIEQSVREEATAAKQIEIALKEQESAEIRKETEKNVAEIEAEIVVIEATANAEAQRILNSVTANAIYTMYEGQFVTETGELDMVAKLDFETNGTGGYLTIQEISDIVVKQLYYDTWDGVLPEVMTGETTGIIVNPE